jgi:hypothetical protein
MDTNLALLGPGMTTDMTILTLHELHSFGKHDQDTNFYRQYLSRPK